MGAGKTTVGKLLARRLQWQFIDLDDRIRERERRTIPQIFRDSGEELFRRVETACLRELLSPGLAHTVLALGGGAIVDPRNADIVRDSGVPVVFLDASPAELFRRCAPEAGARPLLADENQFRQLYERRREDYMATGVRVDSTASAPEQVAAEIVRRLDLRE